ncbi:MAG: lipoate protein ligase C-terminal domain-containing protein [Anaerolineae bacterium]
MKATRGPVSADYKVPGGKLLRVRLTLDEEETPPVIASLALTGDFFIHPEDAIDELEARLIGTPLQAEALQQAAEAFYGTDVQVLGAGPADIVRVIMAAVEGAG